MESIAIVLLVAFIGAIMMGDSDSYSDSEEKAESIEDESMGVEVNVRQEEKER